MKKRILSILLTLVLLLGMLPVQTLAASNLAVNGGTITLNQVYGNMKITELNISNNGSGDPIVVDSATVDGSTIYVVLAQGTSPTASLKAVFSATGIQTTLSHQNNTCTLENGSKTITVSLLAMSGNRPVQTSYKIVYSIKPGAAYNVTIPTGEGFQVTGDKKVSEGLNYEFTVDILEGYQADPVNGLQVTVNGKTVATTNGKYIVSNVSEALTIAVTGVVAKEMCEVTLNSGNGYTISGTSNPYIGEDYSFKVTVDDANYKISAEGMKVLVNGEEGKVTDNGDGTYTIKVLDGNKTITVTGIAEREEFNVTKPNVLGITFNGADTVREGKDYTFTVTVDNAYKADNMVVTDENGGEVTFANGTYTIVKVTAAPKIAITGVEAKQPIDVSLPTVNGLVIRGEDQVFEGEDYIFTVSVKNGYSAENIVVTVNGNILTGSNGTYTVSTVTATPTIIVTATVQKLPGDVTINKVTGNGSLNYIAFADANGNPISGIETDLNGNEISVHLPKSFDLNGQIKAIFDLTDENNDGYPFVSASSETMGNRAYNSRFTEKNISLSNGSATFVFYYYNNSTNAVNNGGQTKYTIKLKVYNDLPEFADGVEAETEATITVGEEYTLNLAPLFTDANDTVLTYQYKVGDGMWTNCNANFSYTNELSGEYLLSFRAFDSKDYSEDVYTVNLTVKDSDETYNVQVTVPEGVTPEFYVSDENGRVGNALEAAVSGNVYTVVVPNNVAYIAWRADGMGMHAAVSADAVLTLVKADFKAMAGETVDTGATVTVKYGELSATGNANSFLLLDGRPYTVNVAPANSGYRANSLTDYTPENGDNTIDLIQKYFTVIAPAGSVVTAGRLDGSYGYSFATPISKETQGENVVYKFAPLVLSGDDTRSNVPFVRVQRPNDPDAVTYWKWGNWNDGVAVDGNVITITKEMLFMDDGGAKDADTVNRTFDPNDLDIGDIYMNINAQGYINLNKGGTKQLNMFRNWQAIESYINSCVALPDFHYEVIDLVGENVVSIAPNANNSAVATLTAANEGTAIVLVTYDAMYSTRAAGGSGAMEDGANIFSAIWPERTGVFVVSVGKDGTAIKTNMTCNGKAFDAEHSPQFYTGTAGASVSFKPEDSCIVTVSRGAVVNGKLTFGEFVAEGVETAADGTVTVSGLTTGRHIIRVEKNGVYTYQVVTAQQVTVEIKDEDGNPVTAETPVTAGTKLTVTFKGLTHPAQKLAKIYNYNPFVWLTDDKANGYGNSTVGAIGSYGFNGTTQSVTVTVPADWDSDTMTLQGTIRLGGFHGTASGVGAHRNLDYSGRDMGKGTEANGDSLGTLPQITLKIKSAPIPATGVTLDKESILLHVTESATLIATATPEGTTDPIEWISSNPAVVTVENGVVTAMSVGTATITVIVGSFSDTCQVTVEAPIAVTGVTLNQQFAKLEPGKQLYLIATVAPADATNKTVTWISSNESVATVNGNGVVTAVSVGTAIIKVTIENFSAECTVVVEEKEDADGIVTVYLSVSHDGKFVVPTATGKVMALQKLDVPYFDLALYGLDIYKIPESDADHGKVTAMHLYIYATEVFYCGINEADAGKGYLYNEGILGTDTMTITGGAGSSFLKKFWGYDENLNYYLNYQYPVYPGTTTGATSDRIVLKDGDIVTVGHFDNTAFFGDPSSIFNYITVVGGSATVTQSDVITLQLYRAGADMGNGGSNTPIKRKLVVYYAKAGAITSGDLTAWTKLGTTDENGQINVNIALFAPGEYVFAVAGRNGDVQTANICSTPGGIVLNVLGSEAGEQVKNVVDLINAIDDPVTLESEASITAARQAYGTIAADNLREAVTNYQKLVDAEAELKRLKDAKADQDAADVFAAQVDAIGAVEATDTCKAKIDAAKDSYNALSDTQKELAAAAKTKLDQAETAYAKLVADEEDKAAAKAVQDLIADIQTVTLDREEVILNARNAYEALEDEQKPLVENLAVLIAAEDRLAQLKKEASIEAVEQLIDAIGTVTIEKEAAIEAARTAYDGLTQELQSQVENYKTLTDAEAALAILKMDKADVEHVYQTTGDYLEKLAKEFGISVNSIGGEWIVIGLERADRNTPDVEDYIGEVVKYIRENINDMEQLHRSKATENARVILALTALGYDVTDVDGHNLLLGLNDMTYVQKQGINGPIWTLIAFDSRDYEIPAGGDVTREKLIQVILDKQLADGGWALTGTKADADMTGMALTALAPYYKTNAAVKAAVDRALVCLAEMQHADGGFGSIDGASSESAAQVIVALTALGIDPHTDSRFIKNGRSVVNALCDYYVEGGGFKHVPFLGLDGMATEQSYYALVAYSRFKENKTSLYDMSDVKFKPIPNDSENPETGDSGNVMLVSVSMLVSLAGLTALLLADRKRKYAGK